MANYCAAGAHRKIVEFIVFLRGGGSHFLVRSSVTVLSLLAGQELVRDSDGARQSTLRSQVLPRSV